MVKKFIGIGLLSGLIAGICSFIYARIVVEPVVGLAIEQEDKESAHDMPGMAHEAAGEHVEVFSRSVQQNIGAGVGTIVFALAMGAFAAVAFTLVWSFLSRRRQTPNPRVVALGVVAATAVAMYFGPFFLYPANPPSVGHADTIGERSGAYLTATVLSIAAVVVCGGAAMWLADRVGALVAGLGAVGLYLVTMVIAAQMLPEFYEVPDGFPAELLADFRVYSLTNQLILWGVLGVAFAVLLGRLARASSSQRTDADLAAVV